MQRTSSKYQQLYSSGKISDWVVLVLVSLLVVVVEVVEQRVL